MRLEQRGHLSIARARSIKNYEVQLEAEHVYRHRQENEADTSSNPMPYIDFLKGRKAVRISVHLNGENQPVAYYRHSEITESVP